MSEFTRRANRLLERLHRGTTQCDHIEQRACIVDEHLTTLHESVQALARIIELSSDAVKTELTSPILAQFFARLELYLRRSLTDNKEKQAYAQTLFFLHTPSVLLSRFSIN